MPITLLKKLNAFIKGKNCTQLKLPKKSQASYNSSKTLCNQFSGAGGDVEGVNVGVEGINVFIEEVNSQIGAIDARGGKRLKLKGMF